MATLELGLDTFGDITYDDEDRLVPAPQVLRDVVVRAVRRD